MGFLTSEARYSSVQTFADLPAATDHIEDIYLVRTTTGIIFVNRKRAGLYRSDGTNWARLGEIVVAAETSPVPGHLISNPPSGKYVIANIYRNEAGNIEFEYDDTPVG